MSFYESDIAVVILLLFGINSLIKGRIELQLEVGKQGVNTIVEEEPAHKKGIILHGWKARVTGIFSVCLGLIVHIYFKSGNVMFSF